MKRWFLILLFLSWAPLVSAQSYVGGTWNSTQTGTTLTTTYSPKSGNGVLILSNWGGCAVAGCVSTQTVTSIQNQNGTNLTCFVASPGTRYQLNSPGPDDEGWALYFCPSINSGVTSIKLNWSAKVYFPEVYVFEFQSGAIQSSNFWDADNGAVTSAAGMSFSVSVTNANANDLMIAFMHNGSNAGPPFPDVTGGAGWTTLGTNPVYQGNDNFQVKTVSASASQTATITWGTMNEQGFGVIAGLKLNTGATALKGTLTDRHTGNPVSGVQVLPCDGTTVCTALATTDANGNYSLTTGQLSGQSSGTLWFRKVGYYVNSLPYTLTTSPTILNDTLLAGGIVLQGKVEDANTQAGIVGASLQLSDPGIVYGNSVTVQSASAGQYEFDSSNFYDPAALGFSVANNSSSSLAVSAAAYAAYQAPGFNLTPPYPVTQNILLTPTGLVRNVTITTNPANLSLLVDGVSYSSQQTFQWVPGSEHTLVASSPQSVATGVQDVFVAWSDGGGASQTIVVPNQDVAYTASFASQYLLSTTVNPSGTGSITPGGWFSPGTAISITATPSASYQFAGFSGNLSGTTNPQSLILNAPSTVVANFSLIPLRVSSVSLNPTSVTGGASSTGRVTLSGPSPAGGIVVNLSSSRTAVATVPASVTVPGGESAATFAIDTTPVTSNTSVLISAVLNGTTRTATLTVKETRVFRRN